MRTPPPSVRPFTFWRASLVMLLAPVVVIAAYFPIRGATTTNSGASAFLPLMVAIFGLASLGAFVPLGLAYYVLIRVFGRVSGLRAMAVAATVGALHAGLSAIAAMFGLGFAFSGVWGNVAPLSILWTGHIPGLPILILAMGIFYGLISARVGFGSRPD